MFVQIESIWVYPIKSCGPVALTQATVEPAGLRLDRRWMLVDADGVFMSQRTLPRMASLKVALLHDGALSVADADLRTLTVEPDASSGAAVTVTVWDDTFEAAHVSDAADHFFSRALGQPCRLVRLPSPDARPIRWPDEAPQDAGQDTSRHVSFADAFPTLVAAAESLDLLNASLDHPVTMARFRPNIVVSGASAFDEDRWAALRADDGFSLSCVKPCSRCSLVNVDPDRAEDDGPEPLRTLARLHTLQLNPEKRRVIFGQNCVHSGPSLIHVGQRLEIIYNDKT
jgi:uncharacterized protein YcbX